MKRNPKRLWTILIVCALAFIWGNSLLPSDASWFLSDLVQRFLSWFTPVISPGESGSGFWGFWVRKAAHFTEFLLLGGFLCARFYDTGKALWPALLASVLAALADESIQYFTDRTSSVFDVWLDLSGAAVGILAALWFIWRKKRGGPGRERDAAAEDGEIHGDPE